MGVVDANAMSGFLVINPRSGQGSTTDELRAATTRLGIETHVLGPGEDAADVAREAPQTALGMAGGDGSLSSVAEVAIERALPFVAVPFGTFNHFARDLGIDRGDPARALRAFSGSEKRIDVARVNGRLFLNNVSLGLYARLVHRREGRGTAAMLKALGLLARHPSGPGVTVDGKRAHARVLVVSNNHYDLDLFAIGERDRLDEGLLYVYVAHGWLPSAWEEQGGRRFLVDAQSSALEAAVDGEPTSLETPIRFEIEPAALRVLLPEGG
jgi:diacylglycerol kinase family enzyme